MKKYEVVRISDDIMLSYYFGDSALPHNDVWGPEESYEVFETDVTGTIEDPRFVEIRRIRNIKLSKCDWTQLADSPLDSEQKQDWADYRQALRDLPNQPDLDPQNFEWPEEPVQE